MNAQLVNLTTLKHQIDGRLRTLSIKFCISIEVFLVSDDFDVLEVEDTDVPKSSAVLVSAKKEPTATAATSTTHTSYIDESYHRIENSTHDKTDTPTVSFKKDPQVCNFLYYRAQC